MARETASNDRFEIPLSSEELSRIEARNAIRQFDWAITHIENAIQLGEPYRPEIYELLIINYLAVKGVRSDAGQLRTYPVFIRGAQHKPLSLPRCARPCRRDARVRFLQLGQESTPSGFVYALEA